ncbi:hypothetical protein Tco_0616161 [Tanacetum coccineum]
MFTNVRFNSIFTNDWDLALLSYSQETKGPYHTDLPTPDDIRRFLQLNRVELNRTMKSQNAVLSPNQILTKELSQDMKRWEELIRENNNIILLISFIQRIGNVPGANPIDNLPYGRVMRPHALKQTRKLQSDYRMPKSCHSVSSSSTHHYGSSSHHGDDDKDDDATRASTLSVPTILIPFTINFQNMTYPLLINQEDDILFRATNPLLLNKTQKMHEEVREGFKSFGKAIKGVFREKK